MRAVVSAACLAAVLALLAPSTSAQWTRYPTRNVPKDAKGAPDMNAPAPRTADGKPDLSGLWRGGGGPARGRGAADAPPPTGLPVAGFANVGQNIKEGLPLTPYGDELLKNRLAANSKDNPEAHCLPMGIIQLHTQGAPRKFIQTPLELVILYEASSERREIFTDGRPLPADDPQPWYNGYSVGRWDGDTLVVETVQFRDGGWLDINGSPLTGTGKLTERFRRPNFGTLEIIVTVEDPKVYTKPFTFRINQRIMPDTDLIEFICSENDRSGPHLVGK